MPRSGIGITRRFFRRRTLAAGGVVGCVAAVGLGALLGERSEGSESPRPNVVVIMTDDQVPADMRAMPQTRRLIGAKGVTFRNSLVSFPLCCPSRASYLTGEYAHNHGVEGNYPPHGGYLRLDPHATLPVWLHAAGYYAVHIGKYLNGYGTESKPTVPPGWDGWHTAIGSTVYRYWGFTLKDNGRRRTYGSPQDRSHRLYQTNVLARKATAAIRGRAGKGPFFLSFAPVAPHVGSGRGMPAPDPVDANSFASARLPRPPSFDEADVSDKPSFVRNLPRLQSGTIATITRRYQARLESLRAVDRAVAAIVKTLRGTGQLSNTYVVFTSDNGFFQGEHRIVHGKYLPYAASTGVPLLVRGPGVPAGRSSGELVANIDLAPAILGIGAASPSRPVDGRSLLPFAEHPGKRSRRAVLLEGFGFDSGEGGNATVSDIEQDGPASAGASSNIGIQAPAYRAIRTRRYLYVEYGDGQRELYDLRRDPYELRSLARDRRYASTRRALARQLHWLQTCSGSACDAGMRAPPAPGG